MTVKAGEKRIVMDVPEKFHLSLKGLSKGVGMTMKDYVIRAIHHQINKDREYDEKNIRE